MWLVHHEYLAHGSRLSPIWLPNFQLSALLRMSFLSNRNHNFATKGNRVEFVSTQLLPRPIYEVFGVPSVPYGLWNLSFNWQVALLYKSQLLWSLLNAYLVVVQIVTTIACFGKFQSGDIIIIMSEFVLNAIAVWIIKRTYGWMLIHIEQIIHTDTRRPTQGRCHHTFYALGICARATVSRLAISTIWSA